MATSRIPAKSDVVCPFLSWFHFLRLGAISRGRSPCHLQTILLRFLRAGVLSTVWTSSIAKPEYNDFTWRVPVDCDDRSTSRCTIYWCYIATHECTFNNRGLGCSCCRGRIFGSHGISRCLSRRYAIPLSGPNRQTRWLRTLPQDSRYFSSRRAIVLEVAPGRLTLADILLKWEALG